MTLQAAVSKPPKATAQEWLKANLFNNWYNSALSVLFVALILYAGFYGLRFLFFTGQWEVVRENLTLFMIGRFPRAEQWRVLTQICLLASAIGLAWGVMRAKKLEVEPDEEPFKLAHIKNYWAVGLLIAILLVLTQTFLPLLFVLGALACLFGFLYVGLSTPKLLRGPAWFIAGVLTLMSWHIISGTQGSAWWWAAALLGFSILRLLRRTEQPWWKITAVIGISTAAIWGIYSFIFEIKGVSWENWSGFHLKPDSYSYSHSHSLSSGAAPCSGQALKPANHQLSLSSFH